MKIAIVGGGISGISTARMLHEKYEVHLFEQHERIGGLIRCDLLEKGLYHRLGGHVFNSQTPAVSAWFWSHFDREHEFHHLARNAKILLGAKLVGYPLENHLYELPLAQQKAVITDLLSLAATRDTAPFASFQDALLRIFGQTLCDVYFLPYNRKIWRGDLAQIPVSWLEGKLPMPKVEEILFSNFSRVTESKMVHSRFYYAKSGGSQFIVDRLAQGLTIHCSRRIDQIELGADGRWSVGGYEGFDAVVFTGDIRRLGTIFPETGSLPAYRSLLGLKTRGITNVFCECDTTDISWLYLPEDQFAANRIIYTGAFSPDNNRGDRMTCVVEFVYGEAQTAIDRDIRALPGKLTPLATNSVGDAYVIQSNDTRSCVQEVKMWAARKGLYLCGRFAEWEYYNIDKAIEAAMSCVEQIEEGKCPE